FILRAIKRGIGVREQGVSIGGVVRTYGDADAGRDRGIDFRASVGGLQGRQDVLGDPASRRRTGKSGYDDGELGAAQPCQGLAVIQYAQYPLCYDLQGLVAGGVPKQIVDLLEPVEIETEDGKPPSRDHARFDLLIQSLGEGTTIGNSGQGIMVCE